MGNSTGKPTAESSLLEKKLQDQSASPICVPLDFLKAITSDFSEERELGRGGFGVVYKGIFQNGKAIAVKKLSEMHLNDDKFQNEVTYLFGLKHQNIVKLKGYCAESHWETAQVDGKHVMAEVRKRLLCFEYINNKSLDKHISVPTAESYGFGWRTRYAIIIGICHGLHYLHTECRIVHLDLKPQNILLDDNMEPKIADFGMSRLFGEQESRIITESCGGTPGYMAPEYLANGLISIKADIFCLGIIIIELMTGSRVYPIAEECYEKFVDNVVGRWRKSLEETYKSVERYAEQVKMCIIMGLMCVDADPNKRPTAQDIVEKLTKQNVMNIKISRGSPQKQWYKVVWSTVKEPQLVHFDVRIGFALEDLLQADADVLGKSTYGTEVYMAKLEDGSLVAVRRFENTNKGEEFEKEVALLGSIRHPNLLPLIAYYSSRDEKLIVFDYMPRGSLFAFLHARGGMSWETRMEIAKGIARGLACLHDDKRIIHGNLTARNVLLDLELHPKIGDFGLFRLMTTAANSKVVELATEMGYPAPELSNLMTASRTKQTDVYNLGIIMLELLTGKPSNINLPQWVASVVHKEWTTVFDQELMLDKAAEDKLIGTMTLALQCVNASPSMRPESWEVLQKLEDNISRPVPSEDPTPSPEDGARNLSLSVRMHRELLKQLVRVKEEALELEMEMKELELEQDNMLRTEAARSAELELEKLLLESNRRSLPHLEMEPPWMLEYLKTAAGQSEDDPFEQYYMLTTELARRAELELEQDYMLTTEAARSWNRRSLSHLEMEPPWMQENARIIYDILMSRKRFNYRELQKKLVRVEEALKYILTIGAEASQEALSELEVEPTGQMPILLGRENDDAVPSEDGLPFGIENQEVPEKFQSGSEIDGDRQNGNTLGSSVQIEHPEVLHPPEHIQSGPEDDGASRLLSEDQLPSSLQHEDWGEVLHQQEQHVVSGLVQMMLAQLPDDQEVLLQQPEAEERLSEEPSSLVQPETHEVVELMIPQGLEDGAEPSEDIPLSVQVQPAAESVLEPPEENGSEPESGRGLSDDDPLPSSSQPEAASEASHEREHVQPEQEDGADGPREQGGDGAAHARPFVLSLFFICFPFVVREVRE